MANRPKVVLAMGARPQFIKGAPVFHALKALDAFDIILLHTGQHYDEMLSGVFFRELGLPRPQYNLEIGSANQSRHWGMLVQRCPAVWKNETPDLVIVIGDTNSTGGVAMSAASHNITVAHIEAGMREWDKSIPEERNKCIADAVSSLLFCSSPSSLKNLNPNDKSVKIFLTGDVGLDVLLDNMPDEETILDILYQWNLEKESYYFMTSHRAANTNHKEHLEELIKIIQALDKIVFWPIHPRTYNAFERFGLIQELESIEHLILNDPISFIETQSLLQHCHMVITDSGGIIKESYYHKKRCVIIDDQTEWVEVVDEKWAIVAGLEHQNVANIISTFEVPTIHASALGDGQAAKKIANHIYEFFSHK